MMRIARRLAPVLSVAFLMVGGSALAAKPDGEMKRVLDALQKLDPQPLASSSVEEARQQPTPADAVKQLLTRKQGAEPRPEAVAKVEDRTYLAADGTELPVRIYTPAGSGPFPVVLYFHGGGWVIADLDTYDATPRALANASGAIVVSAHYRQAPEYKFPAAHEDAVVAYQWTLANASSFDGDAERVALAGESAGANLAFNTAVAAREQQLALPVHMLLVYPVAGSNLSTPSYVANAKARPLGKQEMEWFVQQVFSNEDEVKDPRIDLVSRTDLQGLPSATVITAELDPLRSEGQQLARNLVKAGVKVDAVDYPGVTHEFFGMSAVVTKAKQAVTRAGKDLKAAFKADSARATGQR